VACDASDEDHDGCGVEVCGGGFDGGLRVFPEPAVAVDPSEEAVDDPASRLNGEAHLIGLSLDDLDGEGGGLSDARTLTARIGEDLADEGKGPP